MANITKKEKEILLGIGLVALLVVLFAVFSGGFGTSGPEGEEDEGEAASDHRVVEVSRDDVVAAFPEDFPLERGVQTRESFEFLPAGSSQRQSTLTYISARSFTQNVTTFRNYLQTSDFEIQNETDQDGLQFFYATKGADTLSVTITEQSGQVMVSASYLAD